MPKYIRVQYDQDPTSNGWLLVTPPPGGGDFVAELTHAISNATELQEALEGGFYFGYFDNFNFQSNTDFSFEVIDAALILTSISDWAAQRDDYTGLSHQMRKLTTFTISNQVAGTAGTPHEFRLNKPDAGTDIGEFRLARPTISSDNVPALGVTAAAIESAIANKGQSYTVTDIGTYFHIVRTVNGANGTWTVSNNPTGFNAVGDITEITLSSEPATISDLAATAGVESLTLTWTTPDSGNSPILGVILYKDGIAQDMDVSSPHEITGLAGGVPSGAWTVAAYNVVGEAALSNAVTETPENTPVLGGARRRNRRRMTAG